MLSLHFFHSPVMLMITQPLPLIPGQNFLIRNLIHQIHLLKIIFFIFSLDFTLITLLHSAFMLPAACYILLFHELVIGRNFWCILFFPVAVSLLFLFSFLLFIFGFIFCIVFFFFLRQKSASTFAFQWKQIVWYIVNVARNVMKLAVADFQNQVRQYKYLVHTEIKQKKTQQCSRKHGNIMLKIYEYIYKDPLVPLQFIQCYWTTDEPWQYLKPVLCCYFQSPHDTHCTTEHGQNEECILGAVISTRAMVGRYPNGLYHDHFL